MSTRSLSHLWTVLSSTPAIRARYARNGLSRPEDFIGGRGLARQVRDATREAMDALDGTLVTIADAEVVFLNQFADRPRQVIDYLDPAPWADVQAKMLNPDLTDLDRAAIVDALDAYIEGLRALAGDLAARLHVHSMHVGEVRKEVVKQGHVPRAYRRRKG